jgi:hypothetical protein
LQLLKKHKQFFDCEKELENSIQKVTKNQKILWYVMSESLPLRLAAAFEYGDDKIITDKSLEMIHMDCRFHNTDKCNAEAMTFSMQHSAGQLLTFSLAKYHIFTKDSGFGRLGAWLSNQTEKHVFNMENSKNRNCQLDGADDWSNDAKYWAGI